MKPSQVGSGVETKNHPHKSPVVFLVVSVFSFLKNNKLSDVHWASIQFKRSATKLHLLSPRSQLVQGLVLLPQAQAHAHASSARTSLINTKTSKEKVRAFITALGEWVGYTFYDDRLNNL